MIWSEKQPPRISMTLNFLLFNCYALICASPFQYYPWPLLDCCSRRLHRLLIRGNPRPILAIRTRNHFPNPSCCCSVHAGLLQERQDAVASLRRFSLRYSANSDWDSAEWQKYITCSACDSWLSSRGLYSPRWNACSAACKSRGCTGACIFWYTWFQEICRCRRDLCPVEGPILEPIPICATS